MRPPDLQMFFLWGGSFAMFLKVHSETIFPLSNAEMLQVVPIKARSGNTSRRMLSEVTIFLAPEDLDPRAQESSELRAQISSRLARFGFYPREQTWLAGPSHMNAAPKEPIAPSRILALGVGGMCARSGQGSEPRFTAP